MVFRAGIRKYSEKTKFTQGYKEEGILESHDRNEEMRLIEKGFIWF